MFRDTPHGPEETARSTDEPDGSELSTAGFWLNLQTLYELRLAREELGDRVEKLPTLGNRRMQHS